MTPNTTIGGPTKPRPTRASAAVKAMRDHPAYPWTAAIVGVALAGMSAYLIVREPAAERDHLVFHGAVLAVGLLLIPGVAPAFASGFRSAVTPMVEAWRKSKGTP